jgi:hypothetical protein
MKFSVTFSTDEYERLKEYADTYFRGNISDALRYCFEECELYAPTGILDDDDDNLI